MIYADLKAAVELYLHIRSTEVGELILQFMNESILTFSRMQEWRYLQRNELITLDDSGTYNLGSILRNNLGFEAALLNDGGYAYDKYSYEMFLQQASKTGKYSITGDSLRVDGDAVDLTFLFYSPGQKQILDAITAVDTGLKTFTVSGDVADFYELGKFAIITGDTNGPTNNGTYTVVSAVYTDPNTVITVSETPPSAVAAGNIRASMRYPFTGHAKDECKTTVYYWDIIKQMTIIGLLDYIGDAETMQKEELNFQKKLSALVSVERRGKNMGTPNVIARPNAI